MKLVQKITPFLLLLVSSGCATLPEGPSINVLPTQGKPFEIFQAEDATCRKWAEQQLGNPRQEAYDKNVATGAVTGTAIGAGVGAALGSVSGHAGAGAAIGAASGLLFGTAAGSSTGRVYGMEAQHRYDNAYVQCMYTYGNQVPEYRRITANPSQHIIAAPPPEVLPDQGQYQSPPEPYLDAAPQFIYSPSLDLYVAVGIPYDLVYDGSAYFYFYGGRWYRGPYYNGPWLLATSIGFPRLLLRYRIDEVRHFRDLEFKRYDLDRRHYNGRFHRPEFRGERRR